MTRAAGSFTTTVEPPSGDRDLAVAARSLSKTYGTAKVLDRVDLAVRRGEIHALVGGNGSGKSTLIKIIAGVVHADPGGTISTPAGERPANRSTPGRARAAGLHFVHQDLAVFDSLSIAENLAIGRGFEPGTLGQVRWRHLRSRAASVLARFELDLNPRATVGSLRPAQRTLVAIARALQDQDDATDGVLILDEPTAALSAAEVDRLLTALRRYRDRGQTIVFVSHRLDEVTALADTVTVLRDGKRVATRPVTGLTTGSLAELMVGEGASSTDTRRHAERTPHDGPALLTVHPRDGRSGGPGAFEVRRGEVVGIAGLVGSGRSRLLRSLFGLEGDPGFDVNLAGRRVEVRNAAGAIAAGFAYLPEDRARDASFADLPVATNLSATDVHRYWRHGRLQHRRERADAEVSARTYRIAAASVSMPLQLLSGGNQQKVVVARWLRRNPTVLLLDEPSQGVDVGARAEIHSLIRRATTDGAAALVVSSDFAELAEVCDRVLVMVHGRLTTERTAPSLDPAELTRLAYENVGAPR